MSKNYSSAQANTEMLVDDDELPQEHSRHYYNSVEDVEKALKTDLTAGLSSDNARQRLKMFGPNELKEETGPGMLQMFLRQFMEPLVFVLIVAAIVSSV